jgi:exopolyphosphatase/guanosine-5'-triphosphate,3'-diphosphate pyrophosphatase
MVEARVGLRLEILDGNEEARLIHLGVVNGYPLYDRVACIIDIGGGSTEFIVADGEQPYLVDSVKLGSLRLYDAYLRGRPDPLRAARKLDAHINHLLAPLAQRIRQYRIDIALGTSGTIMGLAHVDAAARDLTLKRVHGYTLSRARLETLQRQMLVMSEAERRRIPGMNPRRADIIVAGNAVLIAALQLLGRDELVVCERALRDGVVVDLARRDRAVAQQFGDERARRLGAVERLAQHYEHLGGHQRHVARLALVLFERLSSLHGLAPGDRDLLWAAAILHGIGRFVAESGHHKHAAYLIRNSELEGWRDDERALIAQVARYYRKAMPKPAHLDYAVLDPATSTASTSWRRCLRIADGLDIRHLGTVTDVSAVPKMASFTSPRRPRATSRANSTLQWRRQTCSNEPSACGSPSTRSKASAYDRGAGSEEEDPARRRRGGDRPFLALQPRKERLRGLDRRRRTHGGRAGAERAARFGGARHHAAAARRDRGL